MVPPCLEYAANHRRIIVCWHRRIGRRMVVYCAHQPCICAGSIRSCAWILHLCGVKHWAQIQKCSRTNRVSQWPQTGKKSTHDSEPRKWKNVTRKGFLRLTPRKWPCTPNTGLVKILLVLSVIGAIERSNANWWRITEMLVMMNWCNWCTGVLTMLNLKYYRIRNLVLNENDCVPFHLRSPNSRDVHRVVTHEKHAAINEKLKNYYKRKTFHIKSQCKIEWKRWI